MQLRWLHGRRDYGHRGCVWWNSGRWPCTGQVHRAANYLVLLNYTARPGWLFITAVLDTADVVYLERWATG